MLILPLHILPLLPTPPLPSPPLSLPPPQREMTLPIARYLGVPIDHVYANRMNWQVHGVGGGGKEGKGGERGGGEGRGQTHSATRFATAIS